MIAELGHLALILALCASLVMGALPLAGGAAGAAPVVRAQRRGAALLLVLTVLSALALAWCFAVNDFSVRYVASHSHSTLATGYRLAALWGSHEGSMLLWVVTLAGWTAAAAWRVNALPPALATRLMAVLGWIAVGLLLFVLLSSNPFVRLMPAPLDGADLNALLQDPGMAFHPPALYLGYVGFALPFAFAVAALWSGSLEAAWLRWLRPWVLVAWAALGLGIVLGSSWAYRVLGWGGWWFWDPVENASLLPWLTGVALLHTITAAERRGQFKRLVLLLCIAAFGLSLIGTFIVRSGAITSVHAFATDPRRGIFILALLGLSMGGALWLYAVRAGRIASGPPFGALSREAFLLANALLFSVVTATVLLATLYPMAMAAIGSARISVGAPYFEAVLLPLMAPALFLMGIGPLAQWQRTPAPALARRLGWALGISVVLALAVLLLIRPGVAVVLGVLAGAWVAITSLLPLARRPWPAGWRPWGLLVAHLGVGVFVLAITLLKGFEVERELPLQVGQSARIGPYEVRLDALQPFDALSHDGIRAQLTLLRQGRVQAVLTPESRRYRTQDMTVATPAIHRTPWRDVYVAMGQSAGPEAWAMRLQFKPAMMWVWAGFLMMSAGGVLAAWGRPAKARVPMGPRVPLATASGDLP